MLDVYFLEIENHWSWHYMILELIMDLKNKYSINLYHKRAVDDPTLLYIDEFNCSISDCELVIYDKQNDTLKALSFSEARTCLFEVFEKRNNPNDLFLVTHRYGWFDPNNDISKNYNFKTISTVYYPWKPYIDYDYYYTVRKFRGYDNLIDKMFCLFTTNRHDPHIMREMGLVSPSPGLLSIQDYLEMAIRHKIGLSIHGVAEVCHRDLEYMAIGLPMLRLEYMNQLNPPLIPDYHYISIPRNSNFPIDGNLDRIGGEDYIAAYKKRFLEVKDDYQFLEFISKNARNYYEMYCRSKNRLRHFLNLLNL